ncbi:chemotaxis protein MotB [Gracilibacillus ureilyticus]|uniref:Chemotaxis protein MotB n=1 Tax=Gracilibacillus ureilyticus TaxID=531814 RepID=A0A1H9TCE6_9BACI|nr:flagellar motor protein MotS [Gracilibacillus ureilyticus]SER94892.1 chemotaxis protein MotB [Gracilibacillus ureilyticus]
MKRRRIKQRSESKGAPKWMVTYSDMITLILVFFILLFTMSQIDAEKFKEVAVALRSSNIFDSMPAIMEEQTITDDHATDVTKNENNQDPSDSLEEIITDTVPSNNDVIREDKDTLDQLLAEVETYLKENNLNNVISATRTDQGVVLVLQENVLFDSGEAEVLDPAKPFLDKVSTLLSNISNQVRVEGHTDNRPISNFRFPSNWELSGARASSVIRYILETNEFDQSRFIAAGFGDTRPVAPNNSIENWSKNRRVEIVILEESET